MVKKQTKIVATISDLRCDVDFLKSLYDAGVNVFRINTAHQTPDITKKVVDNIRAVSSKVGILVDTKGPEIRTRLVKEEGIVLNEGSEICVMYGDEGAKSDSEILYVSHSNFVNEINLEENKTILVDDGDLELEIIKKDGDKLICKVLNSSELKQKKSVNVPGGKFTLPSLTDKDRSYVRFCAENEIDFIAHSFVRGKKDLDEIQSILDEYKSNVKIISKVENREGVDNINEIIQNCYGVMVARGDLAIEIPAEEVPIVQKKIIRACLENAKISITATQMLQSMIKNPRPTRAEVSDIATAIFDGSDAIMLSGETAFGDFPLESVKVMTKVAKKVESSKKFFRRNKFLRWNNSVHKYLAKTIIESTAELPIKAIFAVTRSGSTPRLLSSFRPKTPIYAETFSDRVTRELALVYGVYPSTIDKVKSSDELVSKASKDILSRTDVVDDDLVALIGATPGSRKGADFVEIKTVKELLE